MDFLSKTLNFKNFNFIIFIKIFDKLSIHKQN